MVNNYQFYSSEFKGDYRFSYKGFYTLIPRNIFGSEDIFDKKIGYCENVFKVELDMILPLLERDIKTFRRAFLVKDQPVFFTFTKEDNE